jgi:hypothetical protein
MHYWSGDGIYPHHGHWMPMFQIWENIDTSAMAFDGGIECLCFRGAIELP